MSLDAINKFTKTSVTERYIHPEKMPSPLITLEDLKKAYSKVEIPEVQEDLKRIEDLLKRPKYIECGSCKSPLDMSECKDSPTGTYKYCNVCQKDPEYFGKTIETFEDYERLKSFQRNQRSASFDNNLTEEQCNLKCNNPNCDCRD
jgi:hypothetical protein